MKKITKFFSAMVVLLATIGMTVNAQTYFTDYGNMTKTSGRKLNAVNFTKTNGGEAIGTVTVGQTTATGVPVYFDKTAQKIYVKPGTAVSINFDWTGAWMHNIAFVDWDNNKTFGETLDASNKEYLGKNNAGGGAQVAQPINFTVDAAQTLGEYRMRLIIDWIEGNVTDYAAANAAAISITKNGGSVTDITLVISNKADLINAIAIGQNKHSSANIEGDKVGQYKTALKSALQTAIDAAISIRDNDSATETEITEATSNLQSAINNLVITTPTLSTTDSEVWYYIQGTRPENSYLTDKGEGNQIKSETVIPNDTQLWKFVQEGTGFLMVNKSTSLYLNSDLNTGSNLPTVSAKPTRTLKVRKSNEQSNGIYRLHIENADGNISFRLHAGGSGNAFGAMNWTGNANDNCSWEIIEYSTEAVKAFLLEEINKANSLSNSLSTGTDFGQITPTNKETFTQAIAAAQAVYENPSASETQINQAKADLTQAISNITVETNTNKLISSNEQNYRWYHIVSMSTLEYVAGKVISSEDRDTGNKYTYATKDNSNYSQLFRFENNSEGKVKIINYAQGQLAADGKIADNGADFSLNLLEDKISFNIVAPESNPIHAQQSGSDIVTWTGGVGSASAWKFEFVRELDKTTTNVANTPLSSLAITVSNGIINVAGADSFEVYSIAGQRINTTQPLLKGIYIVKTATTTQKVLVK